MPYGDGNPQIEDAYTRIATEILDALARTALSDYESRCIHYLWRKTYGWQNGHGLSKKVDAIPYSQWVEGTAIGRRSAIRTLQSLVEKNIITKQVVKLSGKNSLTIWGFQKKYKSWAGYIDKPVSAEPPVSHEVVVIEPLPGMEVVSAEPPVSNQPVATTTPVSLEVVTSATKVVTPQPLEVVTPQPPSIDNKDTISIDEEEEQKLFIKVIKELPMWKLEEKKDIDWVKGFFNDYPNATALKLKQCRDYWSEKPVSGKGAWKNRLHNWFQHDKEKPQSGQPTGGKDGKQTELPARPKRLKGPITYIGGAGPHGGEN